MSDSFGSDLTDPDYGRLIFDWEVHPIKKDRKKLYIFLSVTVLFFLFLVEITKSLLFTYIIFIIYLWTLKSFIFKTRYRLYEEGLCISQLGFKDKRPYRSFSAVFDSKDSLLISTMRKYSFLAKTRGIELIFDDLELKAEIEAFLEDKIAQTQ